MKKNNPRIVNSWAFYDWANSVYPLVITSTIFPVYYNAMTTSPEGSDLVNFLGYDFINTALYSYALSASFLLIAFIAPLLTGIADYTGRKKLFMQIFTYIGAFSCSALFFFDHTNLGYGLFFMVMASVGFSGAVFFYNAFLPEIATPDKQDHYSARGFALGYVGSVLLLVFNISMIMFPEFYGIEQPGMPARISFLLTGLWWAGFAQVTFFNLPETRHPERPKDKLLTKGFYELKSVFNQLPGLSRIRYYLLSFLFVSMGLQTVMYMASSFGDKELKLPSENLIMTVLIIQLVAIGGSYLFAWLSKEYGNLKALALAVIIWIGICIGAYFITLPMHFYIIAAVVGLVMGGIQSLSRSTYSKLLPPTDDTASFFSFFNVTEKFGIVIGTASFGYIEQITGSMRNSVFVLTLFFVAGLLFLYMVSRADNIPQEIFADKKT